MWEQARGIEDDHSQTLALRRIELRLRQPTEDGETVIRLLTNVPVAQLSACDVARLYHHRWKIEEAFQRLESVLNSEIASLRHPREALLAFGVAALAYNVLAVVDAARSRQHRLDIAQRVLSAYFIATDIKAHYAGMLIAVIPESRACFDPMTAPQLSQALLNIAAHVTPRTLRKHACAPKLQAKKDYVAVSVARRHIATDGVLAQGRINGPP